MSLYVPTNAEIEHALEVAAGLAPSLWSRLMYAGCILRSGDLAWDGQGWTCRCAREPGVVYAVDFAGCSCPDCTGRHAELHGEAFCPHRLALLALCDICLAHVRERRLGLTKDPVARAAAREAPNAGLLLMRYDGGHKLALVTASARGLLHVPVCQMANVDGRLGFASERDLAALAAWLGQALPLPRPPAANELRPRRPHGLPAALAHLAVLAA